MRRATPLAGPLVVVVVVVSFGSPTKTRARGTVSLACSHCKEVEYPVYHESTVAELAIHWHTKCKVDERIPQRDGEIR